MPRFIAIFVKAEGADARFGQRLWDQLIEGASQFVSFTWQCRRLGDQHHFVEFTHVDCSFVVAVHFMQLIGSHPPC